MKKQMFRILGTQKIKNLEDLKMCNKQSTVLENDIFRLVLSPDCVAQSLILKSNGEECIHTRNNFLRLFLVIGQCRAPDEPIRLCVILAGVERRAEAICRLDIIVHLTLQGLMRE